MSRTATYTTTPASWNPPCVCGSGRRRKRCCENPAVQIAQAKYQTHLELGNALLRAGRLVEACISLRAAIALGPAAPEPVNNLGVALERMGRAGAAGTCYRQALALDSHYAAAHSNVGALLQAQGRAVEAVVSLEAAIACDSGLAAAHSNRAAALRSLGRLAEAEQSARRALQLDADDIESWLNLGNSLNDQGRLEAAAECYLHAAQLSPADPRPHNNLGETRRDQARITEADAAYRDALALAPGFGPAWSNLIYLHGFAHDLPAADELALARLWEQAMVPEAERHAARKAARPVSGAFATLPRTGRKLRLGVVSAELGTHAVAEFLEPFLQQLDRTRFHLTLFPTLGRCCERAARLQSLADAFLPLTGVSDAAALELIRSSGIDVLLDTTGHTAGNRLGLFARRAAPVQCTWIGYWATTGLTEMDWFLTDSAAPSTADAGFSERLLRLPRPALCYRGDPALNIKWQPDPDGVLRLGCFNKFAKIRQETLALWAGALRGLPHARLVLEDRGTDESESHHRIGECLAAHGIAPERVEFIPYAPGHERHMLLYNQIDIALDTVPFNSGTTGFDALWMGVPLVTLAGDWIGGRIASGVLDALGRPEWIAQNSAEFSAILRTLSDRLPRGPALRNRMRLNQRAQMAAGPLCDAASLTRAVEDAFCTIYDAWLAGLHD